jgi:hypothetical protein
VTRAKRSVRQSDTFVASQAAENGGMGTDATPAAIVDPGLNRQLGGALVFVVPMPPRLMNRRGEGSHWRTLHREKLAYWTTLDALASFGARVTGAGWCGFVVPAPPAAPMAQATLGSAMVLGAAMDDDNAMARHKWLVDWLRTRGYIVDDRKRRLTWAGFPEQTVTRKAEPRITLTLSPA